MPSIQNTKVEDILGYLSEWQPLCDVPPAPMFITAVGFEERSPTCFELWCNRVAGAGAAAILIHYPTEQGTCPEQQKRFEDAATIAGIKRFDVTYDRVRLYGELSLLLREQTCSSVLVDISTAASYVFYPIAAALMGLPELDVTVLYTEAETYFPSREEWDEFRKQFEDLDLLEQARLFDETHFQSSGVERVFESPTFSGSNVDNLPMSVAVIPNFSFERVNRMLEFVAERHNYERDRTQWLIGMPPNQWLNGWRHNALWEMFGKPSNHVPVSTLEYKEVLLALHRFWEERHNIDAIIIADLGSKAQHLAVWMFLVMHPEVGLVISEPREFTVKRYSQKSGARWRLHIGRMDSFLRKLQSWNKVSFTWDDGLGH